MSSWLIVPPFAAMAADDIAPADRIVLDLSAPDPAGSVSEATWQPLAAGGRLAALLPSLRSARIDHAVTLAVACGAQTMILPDARSGADIQHLDVLLQPAEARARVAIGTTSIVALAGDNPHGLLAARSFVGKTDRLAALGWDEAGLATWSGAIAPGTDILSMARATLLLAAAAAGVAAIDGVTVQDDPGQVAAASRAAKASGFAGKMTRHASHVGIIAEIFG